MAPLVGVLVIGTALVLPRLGSQSLWLDEGLTVGPAMSATSAHDVIALARAVDTQPPASHLLLWALGGVLPRTEFFYRLPSFVAVELGIVALYATARRLWGPAVALTVAACAQLSPYLAFYAAEARNYGLWFSWITLSLYAALRFCEAARTDEAAPPDPAARAAGVRVLSWALVLGVVNALGLWTHLFHLFVVFAEAVILGCALLTARVPPRARGAIGWLIAAELVTALLFAPWLLVLWGAAQAGAAGVPWTRPFGAASVAYYVFAAHFGSSLGPDLRSLHVLPAAMVVAAHPIALALAAAAIAVTALTYVLLLRDAIRLPQRRSELVALVAWPLLALAGPMAYAALRSFPLHPRHLLLVWPVLPVVLALGLVRLRGVRPLLVAALAVQAFALGNLLFDGHYAKDDERAAVRFAERRSGTVAYVLGDVAALYAKTAEGRPKDFVAFRPDADDVWLVDNRTWEEPNRRHRARLARIMRAMGMRYAGGATAFRGIVLRHWTKPRS